MIYNEKFTGKPVFWVIRWNVLLGVLFYEQYQ